MARLKNAYYIPSSILEGNAIHAACTYLHVFILTSGLDGQGYTLQRNTKNLGLREGRHLLLLLSCVQFVAHAWLRTACTSTALLGCCLRDPLLNELGQSALGIVLRLFDFACINDEGDVVNSDGSLRIHFRAYERASAQSD